MNERRWIDPNSDAPERVRAALAAFDAEPSPASRARGWARFRDPKAREARTWMAWPALAGGAVAGLALVTVALALVAKSPASPDLTAVALTGVAGALGPLAVGAPIRTPAAVRVGRQGQAVLQTAAGDTLRVGPDADIEVRQEPGTHIELASGLVDVEATPRQGGDRLTVGAGRWRVEVVGTRFTVERLADDQVRVEVSEGRVRVLGPGHDGELGPGDVFDSRPSPRAPRAARPESPARKLEGSGPEGRSNRERVAPPEPAIKPATKVASEKVRAPRLESGPDFARRAAREAASEEAPEAASENAPDRVVGAVPNPAPMSRSPRPRTSPLARPSEPTGERSDARGPVAALDPARSEVAAYRAARALKDAGRNAEAAARYRDLIERWPTGELTQVAYLDRIECLLAAGDAAGARVSERRFLHTHPAAGSRPEVAFVLAEVARSLGEHADAAVHYAVAARAERFAESARFLEAVSHARAGDTNRASDAMRAYLDRFPSGANAEAARRALKESQR